MSIFPPSVSRPSEYIAGSAVPSTTAGIKDVKEAPSISVAGKNQPVPGTVGAPPTVGATTPANSQLILLGQNNVPLAFTSLLTGFLSSYLLHWSWVDANKKGSLQNMGTNTLGLALGTGAAIFIPNTFLNPTIKMLLLVPITAWAVPQMIGSITGLWSKKAISKEERKVDKKLRAIQSRKKQLQEEERAAYEARGDINRKKGNSSLKDREFSPFRSRTNEPYMNSEPSRFIQRPDRPMFASR